MGALGDFGSVLDDVDFNNDGSLKVTGKQNVKFYDKKRLAFRARFEKHEDGSFKLDAAGKKILVIDPKTGIPAKDAYEEVVEFVRVETKGDTNIIDDVANDLHRKQFYRQWKFKMEGKIPDGNPIEDFDFLQPSTIMELHYYGIHVIQQVAVMSDLICSRLKDQSGFEIKDIAKQWVKINSPESANLKLTLAEDEIRELKRQLAARPAAATDGLPEPLPRGDVEEVDMSKAVASSDPKPRKRIVE